jgi:hypothetical protein
MENIVAEGNQKPFLRESIVFPIVRLISKMPLSCASILVKLAATFSRNVSPYIRVYLIESGLTVIETVIPLTARGTCSRWSLCYHDSPPLP